jgi:hypothetical protein
MIEYHQLAWIVKYYQSLPSMLAVDYRWALAVTVGIYWLILAMTAS